MSEKPSFWYALTPHIPIMCVACLAALAGALELAHLKPGVFTAAILVCFYVGAQHAEGK